MKISGLVAIVVAVLCSGCGVPLPGADGGTGGGGGGAGAENAADYPLWGWATGSVGLRGSKDQGMSWVSVSEEPGGVVGGVTVGGTTVLISKQGVVSRTTDNGKSWASSTISGLPSGGVWSVGSGPSTVFVGAKGVVFRSADQGATWSSTSMGLPSSANVESIVVSGSTVLVAASLNGLFRSTDDGQTFSAAVTGIAPGVYNNAIAASLAVSTGKVFAAFQGTGVFASSDDGQSWTLASTGLPSTGVGRVWAAGGRVFAAPPTAGLYVSTDGATWTTTCGLPAQTSVLQFANAGSSLFLVTTRDFAGGFFVSPDLGATCTPGGQPVSSTGLSDPLSFVFVR